MGPDLTLKEIIALFGFSWELYIFSNSSPKITSGPLRTLFEGFNLSLIEGMFLTAFHHEK
jgi:hypothetical protein